MINSKLTDEIREKNILLDRFKSDRLKYLDKIENLKIENEKIRSTHCRKRSFAQAKSIMTDPEYVIFETDYNDPGDSQIGGVERDRPDGSRHPSQSILVIPSCSCTNYECQGRPQSSPPPYSTTRNQTNGSSTSTNFTTVRFCGLIYFWIFFY